MQKTRKRHTHIISPGIKRGKAKQDNIRRGRKATPADVAFIADSIYNLKLKPIKCHDLLFRKGSLPDFFRDDDGITDADMFFKDLSASLENAYRIFTGKIPDRLYSTTCPRGRALMSMISQFDTIVPDGYDTNIDFTDGHYHFTIYRICPFDEQWYAFSMKEVDQKLSRSKSQLSDLFYSFLHLFMNCTSIETWWTSCMDYSRDMIEDMLASDDSLDVSFKRECMDALEVYQNGKAAQCKDRIFAAKKLTVEGLESMINQHVRKNHPLVKVMREGIDIMKSFSSWKDYTYVPELSEQPDYFVYLEHQVTIIWDWNDMVTSEYTDYIDNNANEGGIQQPILHIPILPSTAYIDWAIIEKRLQFPQMLGDFFNNTFEHFKTYVNKRENGKARKRAKA